MITVCLAKVKRGLNIVCRELHEIFICSSSSEILALLDRRETNSKKLDTSVLEEIKCSCL